MKIIFGTLELNSIKVENFCLRDDGKNESHVTVILMNLVIFDSESDTI